MTSFQRTETSERVKDLFTILSIMRPHQSAMEDKFLNAYVRNIPGAVEDEIGNITVKIGKDPVVAWSCHVDTVHTWGGIAPVHLYDDGYIRVHPKSRANCLGADDGAGVWLMLQMIKAKKPGMYVFHRGEECSCIGSRWIAKHDPEKFKGIEAAIAFDRKDVGSIITHQFGGRCCSEEFSKSLSDAIGLGMKSDATGTVTDTAQYTDLIGECTNVSVGYKGQHGKTEEQDMGFLLTLLDHMLDFDAKTLVFKRKPGEREKRPGGYYSRRGWAREFSYATDPKLKYEHGKQWDMKENGYVWPESSGKIWDATVKRWVLKSEVVKKEEKTKNGRTFQDTKWAVARVVCTSTKTFDRETNVSTIKYDNVLIPETYSRLVRDYPNEIAKLLAEKNYGMGYIHDRIRAHGGKVQTRYMNKEEVDGLQCPNCERLHKFCSCQ